jgi:hypothetical protein
VQIEDDLFHFGFKYYSKTGQILKFVRNVPT